jgi:hypothetical protein
MMEGPRFMKNSRRPSKLSSAAAAPSAEQPAPASPYNGWFDHLVRRIQAAIEAMRTTYSFDKGNEFETAICEVLQDILPERLGVARGFVVSFDGQVAGDDIIVYDAARFPTFRHLRRDLHKKEHIPAEAVLAYIEAKHTLYLHKTPTKKQHGQSLSKALGQIATLKALRREAVPLPMFHPRFSIDAFNQRRPGFPNIRNPWYGAIWALNVAPDPADETLPPARQLTQRVCDVSPPMSPRLLPDVIAAGDLFACPTILEQQFPGAQSTGTKHVRPFLTRDTRLSVTPGAQSLGLAVLHLQHAIEDLLLGEIPWHRLMLPNLRHAEQLAPGLSAAVMFSADEHAELDYPLPAGTEPPTGGGLPDPAMALPQAMPGEECTSD